MDNPKLLGVSTSGIHANSTDGHLDKERCVEGGVVITEDIS